MASFPTTTKTFATLVDLVDSVLALHQNERGDEMTAVENFLREAATEITVSGGVLTVTKSRHKIQPQSSTADDIDTIDGIPDNTFVILFASDAGTDTLTFKHGTDNISCFGGNDIELSEGFVIGYYDGTTVYLAGGGGGSGSTDDVTSYRLVVSVSSNDLIIALKDKDGNDATASTPIRFQIAGVMREVTGALSITIPDGTNYFNMGSAELATLAVDLAVVAVWDSNSSVVALSATRLFHGGVVSDYSTTTTSERHLFNFSNFTSTDPVTVIGRIEATLSAGAGYTWTSASASAPTNSNTIHRPIDRSRWMYWATQITQGYSANPTNTTYLYKTIGREVQLIMREGANGTSNTTGDGIYSLPFTAATISNMAWQSTHTCTNNGAADAAGLCFILSAGSTINFSRSASAAWTGSGGRRIGLSQGFSYQV